MINTVTATHSEHKITELKGLSLAKAFWEFGRTPLQFSLKCAEEYEDIVSLKLGSSQFFLFNHPSLIEETLSQHQNSIKDDGYRALQDVFGNGILLSHGDSWKYHRRLMQSAFNSDRFTAYAERVVAETELMLKSWQVARTRDVHREMSCLTARIIVRAMFGVDATETAEEIVWAVDRIMQQYADRAEMFYLLPTWLPTKENRQAKRGKKRLNEIVYDIVEQRQQSTKDDVLSTMLNARDEAGNQLSSKELRDEVMTLLLAGYDTTANALTWTLMLLAQNPEVEAKLVAEVTSVLAGRLPAIADLPQLTYTEMVIKESMRLYPPAWILGRELICDCKIGGYDFARGTVVYFSQWAIHRSARFFPNPERFNPDRWANNLEHHLPRCTYFSFGAGARVCIGKAFSMMETKLILAMVVQKFQLTLKSDKAIELLPSFTLRPKHGLKMKIASRK